MSSKLTCAVTGPASLQLTCSCVVYNEPASGGAIDLGIGLPPIAPGSAVPYECLSTVPLAGQVRLLSASGNTQISGMPAGTLVSNLSEYPLLANGRVCQPGAVFVV